MGPRLWRSIKAMPLGYRLSAIGYRRQKYPPATGKINAIEPIAHADSHFNILLRFIPLRTAQIPPAQKSPYNSRYYYARSPPNP
jgi:hypothetical protein